MRMSDLAAGFQVHAIVLVLSVTVLVIITAIVQSTVSDPSKTGRNHRNIEEFRVLVN